MLNRYPTIWPGAWCFACEDRQQLLGFLLRRGRIYGGRSHWSETHRRWLADVSFDHPAQRIVLEELRQAIVEEIGFGTAKARMPADPILVRPGGTLTGPAQIALADIAVYAALLGAIGEVPLAVTTNLNIDLLRKPAVADLIADCRLIKLGKRLAGGRRLRLFLRPGRPGYPRHGDLLDSAAG